MFLRTSDERKMTNAQRRKIMKFADLNEFIKNAIKLTFFDGFCFILKVKEMSKF